MGSVTLMFQLTFQEYNSIWHNLSVNIVSDLTSLKISEPLHTTVICSAINKELIKWNKKAVQSDY